MKIVFKRQALNDLAWFERYYTEIFPDGSRRAEKQFFKAAQTIRNFPEIGRPAMGKAKREYVIPGIPFSFVYRIVVDRIEVLRVLDHRSNRS